MANTIYWRKSYLIDAENEGSYFVEHRGDDGLSTEALAAVAA